MKEIKFMLTIFVLASAIGTALGTEEDTWNLGSSDDWLSTPVKHIGPYYFPNSDLPTGTQRFLNTYPSYSPVVLGGIGTYTPTSNYLVGYNNPYFYDPQAGLDRAVANHAFQKYLDNYYSRYGYYGNYLY